MRWWQFVHAATLWRSWHPHGLIYPGRRKGHSITKVGHLPEIHAKALVKLKLVKFQGCPFKTR